MTFFLNHAFRHLLRDYMISRSIYKRRFIQLPHGSRNQLIDFKYFTTLDSDK